MNAIKYSLLYLKAALVQYSQECKQKYKHLYWQSSSKFKGLHGTDNKFNFVGKEIQNDECWS